MSLCGTIGLFYTQLSAKGKRNIGHGRYVNILVFRVRELCIVQQQKSCQHCIGCKTRYKCFGFMLADSSSTVFGVFCCLSTWCSVTTRSISTSSGKQMSFWHHYSGSKTQNGQMTRLGHGSTKSYFYQLLYT